VATAVDGVTDVVPSDAALLVPPGDPSAVSVAISRILTSAQLAEDLRQKARAAAVAWGPEQMLLQYKRARKTCGKRPGPRQSPGGQSRCCCSTNARIIVPPKRATFDWV